MAIVKIICMGYVKEDDTPFICTADLGTKEVSGNKPTHGLCQSCLTISLKSLAALTK